MCVANGNAAYQEAARRLGRCEAARKQKKITRACQTRTLSSLAISLEGETTRRERGP